MRTHITGAGGRLGSVIKQTLMARGDAVVNSVHELNYLVFAHRYRGPESYEAEMKVNVASVWRAIEAATWNEGDRAIVIVSSVNAQVPGMNQSLAYNVSKAALNQVARFYAKKGPVRINTVSPDTFTGEEPVISKQQVADVIAFLCSDKASGINGQDITINGLPLA